VNSVVSKKYVKNLYYVCIFNVEIDRLCMALNLKVH